MPVPLMIAGGMALTSLAMATSIAFQNYANKKPTKIDNTRLNQQTLAMTSEDLDDLWETDKEKLRNIGSAIPDYDLDSIKRKSDDPNENEDLVYMSVDNYLKLANSNKVEPYIPELIDKVHSVINKYISKNSLEKLHKVPNLTYDTTDNINGIVKGSDGRHVALGLKEAGYDIIPVHLRQIGKAKNIFRHKNEIKPQYLFPIEVNEDVTPLSTKDFIYYSDTK
mgnify:CR=1 FL=1